MKKIPATKNALVLRTDFSNDAAWQVLREVLEEPVGETEANLDFVDDPEFAGLEADQLVTAPSDDPERFFAFLADRTALEHPEHLILAVDLYDEPGRSFRVIPSAVANLEANLSLANMEFAEFAEAVDGDGIFRGF